MFRLALGVSNYTFSVGHAREVGEGQFDRRADSGKFVGGLLIITAWWLLLIGVDWYQ